MQKLTLIVTTIERNKTNDIKQAGFYFFANHMNDPIIESLDAGKARRVAVAVESMLFQR
jgi:hypothetical protein